MLRIHFTSADLARTRLAPSADISWETALSLDLIRSEQISGALGCWQTSTRKQLGRWIRPLLSSAPPAEGFPEFLEQLRRHEYRRLAGILKRYHVDLIAPAWPAIGATVAMDRARRSRELMAGGLEGLLSTLSPLLRWNAPILETDHPVDRDLHLGGRGLVLVPAYLCSREPVIRIEPGRPTVLVHPIAADVRVPIATGRDRRPNGLGALIGSTRAAVLHALAEGCTTSELARRVGISPATASQHAAILRQAGLIHTQRQGPSVLHSVTELGSAVLRTAS